MGCEGTRYEDGDRGEDDDEEDDAYRRPGGRPEPVWVTVGQRGPAARHGPFTAPGVAADRRWATDRRDAVYCASTLLGLIGLVDIANGTLTAVRGLLWLTLALLLYAVLYPPLVTAGPGWLAVRGLWRTRQVATDLLVAARHSDGVQPRLVLRDALGNRVEVDPKVLTGNPLLWHRLDTGARHARASGLLRTGTGVLQRIGERIDAEEGRGVFEASDLS
ncbi:hypothetical protein ACIP88_05810 [Streptomyces uncialis]|uniref:hypothetical protein n=1 Tax=Streptomyces uncialis TaxID=1048205 RepID=UPI0037F83892